MAGLQHMRGNCQAVIESLVRASSSGRSDFWFLPQKGERMWRRNGQTRFNNMHQVCDCVSHCAWLLFLLYLVIYCSCSNSDTAQYWVTGLILLIIWCNVALKCLVHQLCSLSENVCNNCTFRGTITCHWGSTFKKTTPGRSISVLLWTLKGK